MPLCYKNNVEARADLLQKSKEWRASFNALSSTKTVGLKDMATTMTSMVDCVTSQQNFIHEAMDIQDKRIESLDKEWNYLREWETRHVAKRKKTGEGSKHWKRRLENFSWKLSLLREKPRQQSQQHN